MRLRLVDIVWYYSRYYNTDYDTLESTLYSNNDCLADKLYYFYECGIEDILEEVK